MSAFKDARVGPVAPASPGTSSIGAGGCHTAPSAAATGKGPLPSLTVPGGRTMSSQATNFRASSSMVGTLRAAYRFGGQGGGGSQDRDKGQWSSSHTGKHTFSSSPCMQLQ